MTNATLTLVDVRHVQTYLFNANELKQNLGASALVEQATHEWIIESLPARCNARWDAEKYEVIFDDRTLHKDPLDAEVIYMGGGNAGILFSTYQEAKNFTQRYTDILLVRTPSLEAAVAHVQNVDLSQRGALKEAWHTLQRKEMPARKEGRLVSQPILGVSVSAECAYTGLPAITEMIENGRGTLLSAQSYVKQNRATVQRANGRLGALLNIEGFEYPLDFDELGGDRGRSSFMAVVHVDGNGMGKRIEKYVEHDDNQEMIRQMREFSEKLNRVSLDAIRSVRDYLARTITVDSKGAYQLVDRFDPNEKVRLSSNSLPIRPLVFGGDDVTFVCEGRLGLPLAAKILEAFSTAKLPDEMKKVYACAGVAIVHSHYPFARAYALAEELCDKAKEQARKWDEEKRVSLLNWHITPSSLTLDWKEIQKREYLNGKLLLRPLVIAKDPQISNPVWQTWQSFTEEIYGFRTGWWSTQRNKQKELQETLRKGPEATRKFTNLHEYLPEINGQHPERDAHITGWKEDSQCLYYDALEAMDLFVYPEDI